MDALVSLPDHTAVPFALELIGEHNTAVNSNRITGDAALKYRLLQARGYAVVPISCREWDRIGFGEIFTKAMYVQVGRAGGRAGRGATRPILHLCRQQPSTRA